MDAPAAKKTNRATPEAGRFELVCPYSPMGDQPKAIETLSRGLVAGAPHQTLLGITGSGKTFTMAAVIEQVNRPTLVLSPNKTLAAQLYAEFKDLFPKNAVEYFVSYYDYYQPEAYVPSSDTFIEKDASRNENIERLRNSATRSLLERRDVLIVASVSCIYGLGSPDNYETMALPLAKGRSIERDDLLRTLTRMQYARAGADFRRGTFRARGDVIEVFPSYEEDAVVRIELFGDEIDSLVVVDPLRGEVLADMASTTLYPANHYVAPGDRLQKAVIGIEAEMRERVQWFKERNLLLEAQRIEQRTRHDIEMLKQTGVCPGIENYSRWMDGRAPGESPFTLLHYFPDEWVVFVDESHVTIPQVGGMYHGDRSRKETLVQHGFRLPSALDNRPLRFEEWEGLARRVVHVSATPAAYELRHSGGRIAEQIVRPTGLLDPLLEVRPAKTQVDDLLHEIRATTKAGWRTLATVLTKRMAEELTNYYAEAGVKVRYLHSEIDAIERTAILRDLRLGAFDVLVGINLLREGLDLPEVALVGILDADKEGFLRSTTSLIQTCGRAARNAQGRVILYADRGTDSMERAIGEMTRRRARQIEYNAERGIVPQTVIKPVRDSLEALYSMDYVELAPAPEAPRKGRKGGKGSSIGPLGDPTLLDPARLRGEIERTKDDMLRAAESLRFEDAAALRDRLKLLERAELEQP
jgi:excinuclease ABC subunit B